MKYIHSVFEYQLPHEEQLHSPHSFHWGLNEPQDIGLSCIYCDSIFLHRNSHKHIQRTLYSICPLGRE